MKTAKEMWEETVRELELQDQTNNFDVVERRKNMPASYLNRLSPAEQEKYLKSRDFAERRALEKKAAGKAYGSDLSDAAGDALVFGLGPNIAGAVSAATAPFRGKSAKDEYNRARNKALDEREFRQMNNPSTSVLGEAVPFVATALPRGVAKGGKVLVQALKDGSLTGVQSALAGLGYGQPETWDEALQIIAANGGIGAVLGFGSSYGSQRLGKAAERGVQPVQKLQPGSIADVMADRTKGRLQPWLAEGRSRDIIDELKSKTRPMTAEAPVQTDKVARQRAEYEAQRARAKAEKIRASKASWDAEQKRMAEIPEQVKALQAEAQNAVQSAAAKGAGPDELKAIQESYVNRMMTLRDEYKALKFPSGYRRNETGAADAETVVNIQREVASPAELEALRQYELSMKTPYDIATRPGVEVPFPSRTKETYEITEDAREAANKRMWDTQAARSEKERYAQAEKDLRNAEQDAARKEAALGDMPADYTPVNIGAPVERGFEIANKLRNGETLTPQEIEIANRFIRELNKGRSLPKSQMADDIQSGLRRGVELATNNVSSSVLGSLGGGGVGAGLAGPVGAVVGGVIGGLAGPKAIGNSPLAARSPRTIAEIGEAPIPGRTTRIPSVLNRTVVPGTQLAARGYAQYQNMQSTPEDGEDYLGELPDGPTKDVLLQTKPSARQKSKETDTQGMIKVDEDGREYIMSNDGSTKIYVDK